MAEPVYGLTARDAKLLKQMADKHRQRKPATDRRTRRIGSGTRQSDG